MSEHSHQAGPIARWRASRRCRALDNAALRAEFELERPRGMLARLKAYAASVEDLERARVHASLWVSLPRPVVPAVATPPGDDAPLTDAARPADAAPPADAPPADLRVRASRARRPRQAQDPRS